MNLSELGNIIVTLSLLNVFLLMNLLNFNKLNYNLVLGLLIISSILIFYGVGVINFQKLNYEYTKEIQILTEFFAGLSICLFVLLFLYGCYLILKKNNRVVVI